MSLARTSAGFYFTIIIFDSQVLLLGAKVVCPQVIGYDPQRPRCYQASRSTMDSCGGWIGRFMPMLFTTCWKLQETTCMWVNAALSGTLSWWQETRMYIPSGVHLSAANCTSTVRTVSEKCTSWRPASPCKSISLVVWGSLAPTDTMWAGGRFVGQRLKNTAAIILDITTVVSYGLLEVTRIGLPSNHRSKTDCKQRQDASVWLGYREVHTENLRRSSNWKTWFDLIRIGSMRKLVDCHGINGLYDLRFCVIDDWIFAMILFAFSLITPEFSFQSN